MINFESFLHTNLLNFIIMFLILCWIFKKFNLGNMVDSMAQKTKDKVKTSTSELNSAVEKLKCVETEYQKVPEISQKILEDAKKSASSIKIKIEQETIEAINSAQNSYEKNVEAQIEKTKDGLTKSVGKTSITLAKSELEKLLTPEIQRQYIKESIENLERIEFYGN